MNKPSAMRAIEAVTRRDIRAVILEAVQEAGNVQAAADALGQGRATFYKWITDLNGQIIPSDRVTFAGYDPELDPRETNAEAADYVRSQRELVGAE